MNAKRLRIFQVLSEALIPLLGYFLWEWSLYFILLFYVLDLLTDYFVSIVKSKKITQQQGGNIAKNISVGGLLLILCIAFFHIATLLVHPEINFKAEVLDFWTYEDMGIQQGYLLIPLVLFASYQRYKMDFLMRGEDRKMKLSTLWNSKNRAYLIIIAFSGLVAGLSQLISFNDAIYIMAIVFFSSIYQLFFGSR